MLILAALPDHLPDHDWGDVHLAQVASICRNCRSVEIDDGGWRRATFFLQCKMSRIVALSGHAVCREARPLAVLVNPDNATNTETTLKEVEAAARALGLQIQVLRASTSREIDAAFATLGRERRDALFVSSEGLFVSRRVQVAILTAQRSIPASYGSREQVEAGGLMSYGSDTADAWRQGGAYVGRILKGDQPAALPVVQSSKFELVINVETARMLRLAIPPTLLATADE
jgi:putative ABC transport system substrate-binding protein